MIQTTAILAALVFSGFVGFVAGAAGVATLWVVTVLRRRPTKDPIDQEYKALLDREGR